MEKITPPWKLGQLAALLNGELHGPADLVLERPVAAGTTDAAGITFAESAKYLKTAESVEVGALLIPPKLESAVPHIKVENPRVAFGALLSWAYKDVPTNSGIHPSAIISETAAVDPSASVGPYVVVEAGSRIGASCRIYAHAFIGEDCVLGEGCVVYPHAVLYRDVDMGARCVIHAGAVLGKDGFGFNWNGAEQVRVPQAGGVRLGDDCEIGALTAVDRATCSDTTLGNGVKVDNQNQIAHNVRIGDHTVVAGQCGITGSTTIGSRVTIAGKVDFSNHVTVVDDVILGGRTGVNSDISEPGAYFGTPARPFREGQRVMMAQQQLPELIQRVRDLERRLRELEGDQ